MGLKIKRLQDMKHQTEALKAMDGREYFGLFMDPGTGKTRVALKDAWREYDRGHIDAVLVIAPNSVKTSWVKWDHMKEDAADLDQVEEHLPEHLPRILKGVWVSSASGKDKKAWSEFEDAINHRHHKLVILVINYEAMLSEQFFEFLKAFCNELRVMIIADESTRIGKMGSKRTKRAIKLARFCLFRRILTGTPVVKSPMKIYSQSKFLDEKAIPWRSVFSFRNHFCVMGGFKNYQILSFKNLEELTEIILRWSYRARKEDCLDLPPRVYLKRRVYMTPEQERAYNTMRKEFYAEVAGKEITASIVLTQIMRLQQIAGGYITDKDGVIHEIVPPERNPKLLEAYEILDSAPGSVVTWFRFKPELLGFRKLLKPGSFFEFHGDIPEKLRPAIRTAFKRRERPYLLGTESTGGIGINEFLVADVVTHVSSDFDTEKRIQADDRNHRIGSEMHEKITYYDILVPNTVDVKIHRVLRSDTQISAKLLRDNWKEWI